MISKCKMGFVILHYKAKEITIQAVDAIQSICPDSTQFKIVIVDNGSPDGSGEELKKRYSEDNQITMLLSRDNLGFAKGNNLGYAYAKNTLQCEYICVMNNDVIISQREFVDMVETEFANSSFAVLGPHITLKDGSENVIAFDMPTRKELIRDRKRYIHFVKHMKSSLNRMWHYIDCGWNLFILETRKLLHRGAEVMNPQERYENRRLHGCCLVFSPIYIEAFDDAFLPITFMYREEELLYLRVCKHGMKMVYNPELKVLHLEDMSTNSAWNNNLDLEIFRYSCQIDSMQVLIDYMDDLQIYVSTFGQKVMKLPHTTPIEVGARNREHFLYPLRDDVGDHISDENPYYGELTGLYWIYKNRYKSRFMGFGHYNKVLDIKASRAIQFLSQSDNRFIVAIGGPIREHKEPSEVSALIEILRQDYPDYYESFMTLYDEKGAGKECNACQLFITGHSSFDAYCDFLFGVLRKLRQRLGEKEGERFYMRYCAFLGERLLSVYLHANHCEVMEVPVLFSSLKLRIAGKIATFLRLNRKNETYRSLAGKVNVKSSWKSKNRGRN